MYSYAIATDNDNLAKELRLELKKWEKSYAAAHQGRKVGREDIKQYPEIGQKLPLCCLPTYRLTEPSTQIPTIRETAKIYLKATSPSQCHSLKKALYYRLIPCSLIPFSIQASKARSLRRSRSDFHL